ncbi:hypothetical protein AAHA92_20843 [Salvia divinorum]|uniref:Uncharacterized protein n=1 Tax=Salvia divinorum TaxID=28513 RepID=A0ABD1GIH8_SALDI
MFGETDENVPLWYVACIVFSVTTVSVDGCRSLRWFGCGSFVCAKSLIDDASSGIVDTYSAETVNVKGKAEQMVAVKIMSQVSSFTYLGRNHYSNTGESILSVGCAAEESVGTKSVVQVSSLTSIGRNHYPDNEKYILSVGCETQQMIATKVNGSFTNVVKMTL